MNTANESRLSCGPMGWVLALSTLLVSAGLLLGNRGTTDPDDDGAKDSVVRDAAVAFVATLSAEQRDLALYAFDDDARLDWHYVPRRGHGISINEMNDAQRAAVHRLLRAGLSSTGYLKVSGVMQLEAVLQEVESRGGRNASHRDPGRYRVAIFGDPNAGHPWGWRIEGHHLSISCSSITDEVIVATPAFLGANPAEVRDGPFAGWRLLAAEADHGRRLFQALNDEQRATALIAGASPPDIIMRPGHDDAPPLRGVSASEMNDEQRTLLRTLIVEYVQTFKPDVADTYLDRYLAPAHLDNTRFMWVGDTTDSNRRHYYRVQGPALVIEYDNVGDGNHVHTVVRDTEHDFGLNLLRDHYDTDHDGGG